MSLSKLTRILLAAGAGGVLSFAVPSLARPSNDVPYCSATVTDHCMQRSNGGGWHKGRTEGRRWARHGHHHMGHHHHHHHHHHAAGAGKH